MVPLASMVSAVDAPDGFVQGTNNLNALTLNLAVGYGLPPGGPQQPNHRLEVKFKSHLSAPCPSNGTGQGGREYH